MIALITTGIRQHFPALGLYQFKLDDVLEKTRTNPSEKFEGWVLGLLQDQMVIYELKGIRNMVEIYKIKNFSIYQNSLNNINMDQLNEISNYVFTKDYYCTYPEPNL